VARALVVSVHDVAPATRPRVEKMLKALTRLGVSRASLLVVPDYHRAGRSLGDSVFVSWLQGLQTLGHEIVIHGFYHQRARRELESARQKLVTRVYTADEGEFYDLDYEGALRLLREAQNEFSARGIHPVGFIAPAWLLGAEAQRAVMAAGFRYTTTLRGVRDLVSGGEFLSQSLVYSVRSDWRCAVSLFWNRTLFRHLMRNPLLRLSVHPPDIEHPGIWRQIEALTRRGLRDRKPVTYQEWLTQKSESGIPQPEMA
jgi:hypothetical protein